MHDPTGSLKLSGSSSYQIAIELLISGFQPTKLPVPSMPVVNETVPTRINENQDFKPNCTIEYAGIPTYLTSVYCALSTWYKCQCILRKHFYTSGNIWHVQVIHVKADPGSPYIFYGILYIGKFLRFKNFVIVPKCKNFLPKFTLQQTIITPNNLQYYR